MRISESVSFTKISNRRLAVADLSHITRTMVQEYLDERYNTTGKWYFFNRLNVPDVLSNKGYAKLLLKQVVDWADANKINILNHVSPSGKLNLKQLIRLYEKFDFELVPDIDNLMFRYFK